MKLVIGGTISIILGVLGLTVYFLNFVSVIQGILPLIFIAGGILIIMLKREEDAFEPAEHEDSSDQTDQAVTMASDALGSEEPLSGQTEPALIESMDTQTADGFVGNQNSHVFHTLLCKYATGKKCTQQFITREQAIEQGYKPCNVCKP
ncbi:MAG: Ada metal-binding domain-containing protein [Pseudomonadota bacterium]